MRTGNDMAIHESSMRMLVGFWVRSAMELRRYLMQNETTVTATPNVMTSESSSMNVKIASTAEAVVDPASGHNWNPVFMSTGSLHGVWHVLRRRMSSYLCLAQRESDESDQAE